MLCRKRRQKPSLRWSQPTSRSLSLRRPLYRPPNLSLLSGQRLWLSLLSSQRRWQRSPLQRSPR